MNTLSHTHKSERINYYFGSKYRTYLSRVRDYPVLFEGVPLVFVVLSQERLAGRIQKSVGVEKAIEIIELPLTHKDFQQYADRILSPILEDTGPQTFLLPA